jgi:serine/threonine protein kinase
LFKTNDFDGTVKLTDFGLSKEIETDDSDHAFSTTTIQVDTEEIASFGFYAPEVYRKEKQSPKVDIFSLGCCLFYLLSKGRRPHEDPKQPTNKFVLNSNILTGRFNLAAIAHLPEAAHMIRHMIDQQKERRPTVQWLLGWHPYFWSARKRFEFLCAVGNKEGKKAVLQSASLCSRILGKDASDVGGWRKCLAEFVWEDHTGDIKHRQCYNCKSIPHLLRFMRNAKEHPKAGSASAAMFESAGGIEYYFMQQFPKLLLCVWEAVARAGWGQSMQSEFKPYLPSNANSLPAPVAASASNKAPSASNVLPSVGAGAGAGTGAGAGAGAATAADVSQWTPQQVAGWVASFGREYAQYHDTIVDNGINGEALLDDFGDDELDDLKVDKKSHRKRILREAKKLAS